jgi:hypothetical protein
MSEPIPKSGQRKDLEIAAAEWLFQDGPSPVTSSHPAPIVPDSGEGFALADAPVEPGSAQVTAGPLEWQPPAQRRSGMVAPSAPAVEQVWSRSAEWGPTLLYLAGWAVLVCWLLYQTLSAELYGPAMLMLLIGGLGAAFFLYPILITLERPVRVTPEQAARDYFGALSHHFPHHRRMWLLLSTRGRTSAQFASFEGFKAYWVKRLAQLRQGQTSPLSPLVFQVEEFRAEKSAGKSEIAARFRVKVLVRGRRSEGPIWSIPLDRTFARGPDNMWYLDDGTLTEPSEQPSDSNKEGGEHRAAFP